MPRIEQRPDRYLHAPRLTLGADGAARLHLIAWEGDAERVVRFAIDDAGAVTEIDAGPLQSGIIALTRGDRAEPGDAASEREEARDGERTWVTLRDGVASVWLARGKQDILVFRALGSAAAPCLAVTDGGTWVAFHHDVREDDAQSDVAKWIALRFVDRAGAVHEPTATMRERDRDRQGVEQSFEFPALCVGERGAVALFGRGSHNFWRQDLDATGFHERTPLSDGEWGSRGRHIAALSVGARLVVARRDRKGIEVDVQAAPTGDAPALTVARVDWTDAPAAAAGRAALRTARDDARARDPARSVGLVTLFGDIQQHSAHSDGVGSADEVYQRARYRYGDDFVALTDHESFLGKRTGPGEWTYLQQVADDYDAPGAFATLLAYEWTGKMFPGPGHKCVYYPMRGVPIVSRDDVPEGAELVRRVRALGGFASPHHIGWTGADAPGHDDDGQPLWEIVSCHGCYEHVAHPLGQRGELKDQMADVMLKRGMRFGFTGSSDSHGLLWHHGEARKRDPYRTGLTGVQAHDCSRAAVMEALMARRCYATSGAKILLDVRADGAPMGSALDDRAEAAFTVSAVGTAELARIELVGPSGVLARTAPNAAEGRLEARVGGAFVYARVVQIDGEMAWSSPVFFGGQARPMSSTP